MTGTTIGWNVTVFRVQRVIVKRSAEFSGSQPCDAWHSHLPALVLHHAAAGAFPECSFPRLETMQAYYAAVSRHDHQQQDQHTELAQNTHYLTKTTFNEV